MPVAEETTPRRVTLTRERIVELALEIIDEDGLDAHEHAPAGRPRPASSR